MVKTSPARGEQPEGGAPSSPAFVRVSSGAPGHRAARCAPTPPGGWRSRLAAGRCRRRRRWVARPAERRTASQRRRVPRREGHVRGRGRPGKDRGGFQGSGARRSAQPPGMVPAVAGAGRGASGGPRRGQAQPSLGPRGAARATGAATALAQEHKKRPPPARAVEPSGPAVGPRRGPGPVWPRASRGSGLWSSLGLGTSLI